MEFNVLDFALSQLPVQSLDATHRPFNRHYFIFITTCASEALSLRMIKTVDCSYMLKQKSQTLPDAGIIVPHTGYMFAAMYAI